ncbi:hypothetical protein O6H91_07G085100 [Diphasiastrum complanatum]|uniref:Uncharacterized protein n=2 Tax=Diphasiastrum complanatum TaxID=34168 RepID=A0ACC2D7H7_DIPCM|nr:hypothetical protein O6H91_07G085100 [Diphasiastrum complanatum]
MAAPVRCTFMDTVSCLGGNTTNKNGFTSTSPIMGGSQLRCFSKLQPAASVLRLPLKKHWLCISPSRHSPRNLLLRQEDRLAPVCFSTSAGVETKWERWAPLVGNAKFGTKGSCFHTSSAGGVVSSVGRNFICLSGDGSAEDGELTDERAANGVKTSNFEDETQLTKKNGYFVWRILERWHVPWDLSVTLLGMFAWLISFLLTGLTVALSSAYLGIGQGALLDLEKQALYILANQILETALGLGTIFAIVKRYKPLSPDLFVYDWSDPLDIQRGWLLWGAIGILFAGAGIALASTVTSMLLGEPPTREEGDALLQLLPIIGASPTSTASLIVVTGVLAPLLEETVFRGFLLTSLSKWMPTPAAIFLSSSAFAIAHLTPGEFPQLFALGVLLGFTYSQTRNLLTPMLVHSVWNSGVIILLTFLRLQGYNIRELI